MNPASYYFAVSMAAYKVADTVAYTMDAIARLSPSRIVILYWQ